MSAAYLPHPRQVDVLKGIAMFDELRVPLLSLLENMAYFTDPHGGVHHPFGTSQACPPPPRPRAVVLLTPYP